MSLNEFFAGNPGNVYLRPVGLPDCFSLPGLPHGCKPPPPPPPLAMQPPPCPSGPQKPRTMAAVSPLHQVTPPQPNLAAYDAAAANSLNAFGTTQRTASFAAALRKLAKQAVDPITGEKDMAQISPVSSPALAQGSLTPKRNGPSTGQTQPMYLNSNSGHQVCSSSYPSSSPPVVTIAPSRPHPTHTSDSRKLQVLDLAGMPQSSQTNPVSNGHMTDQISLKLDAAKANARQTAADKWDEQSNKSLTTSSASSSQSRPHATIAPLPRPDDSLTSSRGFQPYRSAEDIRTSMPHHLSPFEHHPQASYPYAPAFLPPPHLPHPAYRFDDPLFLDRFALLRSPVMSFHTQPAMMAAPAAFYPQSRYDLLAQSLSLSNSSLLHQERLKLEEERRQREKEAELDLSRKREQERKEKEQKEKEAKEKEHKEKDKEKRDKEKIHREKEHTESSSNSRISHHTTTSHIKRSETLPRRNDQAINNSVNHSSPPVTSSSAPLNLVVHPTAEPQRKETELWIPWQQQQPSHHNNSRSNHHSKEGQQEEATENVHSFRPPPLLPQENHHILPPPPPPPPPPTTTTTSAKDGTAMEKFQAPPYNYPVFQDKRNITVPEMNTIETDPKKSFPLIPPSTASNGSNIVNNNNNNINNNSYRKFDTVHHHIAELSKKDSAPSEWKHEKLQKAYANNHRKNISEVKKLREESHMNNSNTVVTSNSNAHHTAQRKQYVNGLIKPILSQGEGMHARLLETEKCRLEFSNHSANKLLNNNSNKLATSSLVHNNLQMNETDVNMPYYVDYHIMSTLKKTDTTPVRSKLDKEAEDMKKKGLQEVDYDEPSMKEFLIITKGPPLPLDTNPKKMKFLKVLGLTSHLKRKEIEYDIYLKRRKLHRDDETVWPLESQPEKSTKEISLHDSFKNLEKLSERLRTEAGSDKVEFFTKLGLNALTLHQKEENARLRKFVEDERKRRAARLAAKADKNLSPPQLVKAKNETDDIKQEESTTVSRQAANSAHSSSDKPAQTNSNLAVQGEKVPYANATAKEECTASGQALSTTENNCFVSPQEPDASKRNKFRTKYSFKRGHSLKCEWKPTLLPSAAQNDEKCENAPSPLVKNEPQAPFTCKSTATQADLAVGSDGVEDKSKSFNWPGLDAVIEAYYRHNKEQIIEKELLTERCNQLRRHQEELTREANQLSKTMSDLLKVKRELDEKRMQHEQALQKLKIFVQAGR